MSERPPLTSAQLYVLLLIAFGLWLFVAIFGFGCGPVHPTTQPKPPFDPVAAGVKCDAIWRELLERDLKDDPAGRAGCIDAFRTQTEAQIRANVKASPEYITKHQPKPPPSERFVKGKPKPTKDGWRYPDGSRFHWRGVSGFGIVEAVAHGRESVADAFMATVRGAGKGAKVVRVFTTNHGDAQWQQLPPVDGRKALPRVLEFAKQRDLYVEAVALVGTKAWTSTQITDQVKAIAAICNAAENCLLEIANEPYHSSQHSSLVSPATAKRLIALVPKTLPVAYGAARTDEPLKDNPAAGYKAPRREGRVDDGTLYCASGQTFVTYHRKRNEDVWDDLRRFTENQKVADECGMPGVDNEPYGFAEAPKVGTNKRRVDAYIARAQGYFARLFEQGSNLHWDAGFALNIGPKQLAALVAFTQGHAEPPDSLSFDFFNGKRTGSAVSDASFIGPSCSGCAVMRAFTWTAPGYNRFAWVGLKPGRDPKPVWKDGWKPKREVWSAPGLQVLELSK